MVYPAMLEHPAGGVSALAGLLACGTYGRRMEPAWSNGKAAYRCRHGHTSAAAPDPGRPKNAYVREDRTLPATGYRLPLLLVMVPLVSRVPEHEGSW
jgi:hypothetical protein